MEIQEKAVSCGLGIVSRLSLTRYKHPSWPPYEAMRQAVEKLSVRPDVFLNDAVGDSRALTRAGR